MSESVPDPDEGSEATEPTEEGAEEPSIEPAPAPAYTRPSRRSLAVAAALVAIVALIALDFSYILRAAHRRAGAAAGSVSGAPVASVPSQDPSGVPAMSRSAPADPAFEDGEEPPTNEEPKKPKRSERAVLGSVRDAAARACKTSVLDRLNRQIIAQSRCIDRSAFVEVPRQPNLETGPNVFLYLEASARDHLLRALRANKKNTMTVNSALRTVAQQYLLWRWAASKRCGIEIATPPGESNHETGLALDIAEAPAWRAALEAQDFHWLGAIDRVHFDYKGPNAQSRASVDVKAFQQLWNANHEDDPIAENGQFDAATLARLEQAPAKGFSQGPRCKR